VFGMILKKLGKKVPEYGSDYENRIRVKFVFDFVQMRFQQFVGRHKLFWKFIPLFKAKIRVK
jgi:hypothetical protein